MTWAPEPDRTITVRGDVSREAVLDAARRLRPVSADEWATAFSTPGPD